MIALIEAFLNSFYIWITLMFSIFLCIHQNQKGRRIGTMALVLVLGSSIFYLIRTIILLSPDGLLEFNAFQSIAKQIDTLLYSLFTLLLYFIMGRDWFGKSSKRTFILLLLTLAGVGSVFLPTFLVNGSLHVIRMIPFIMMSILLYTWSNLNSSGSSSSILRFLVLSFAILESGITFVHEFSPITLVWMIVKIIVFLGLIFYSVKLMNPKYSITLLFDMSLTFLILGLIGGVFYREFTKYYAWELKTTLSVIHVHLIVLGFFMVILLYILIKSYLNEMASIKIPFFFYVLGLIWTITAFFVRGIYTITNPTGGLFPDPALSGFAGIGHILVSVTLVCLLLKVHALHTLKEVK